MSKKMMLAGLAVLLLAAQSANLLGSSQDSLQGQKAAFKSSLESLGFVVDQRGRLVNLDLAVKFCEGTWPCGFGYNNDTPYLVFKMDPLAVGFQAIGFQLNPDEALVFIGQTPPQALYYSFTAFLNARFSPAERTLKILMSNLGDSLSHCFIRTAGTPFGAAGNPFSQDTLIIVAADQSVASLVMSAAVAGGFPLSLINILPIPGNWVRLGKTVQNDRFAVVMRCAFFKDVAEGNRYLGLDTMAHGEAVSPAAEVWRITPNSGGPSIALNPFQPMPLRIRGTGETEYELWDKVEALRAAIINSYPGYEARDLDISQWVPEGGEAIQRGINAWAPTRDALYLSTQEYFTLAEDEFLIVYGVNHKASGKATYANAVAYSMDPALTDFPYGPNTPGWTGWREYLGLTTINSEEHMQGSARAFLPQAAIPLNAKGEELLYAVKVARREDSSDGAVCCVLPPASCSRMTLTEFLIGFRAYVEPRTKIGPSFSEIIYDRVLKFKPRS
jgi:hypothetical protein